MDVQVEELSTVARKLVITVDAKTVDQKLEDAYGALKKEVKLPGFRKGKVPRKVLEQRFGPDVSERAAAELAQELVPKELGKQKIEPASDPEVEHGRMTRGKALKLTVTVEIKPAIELASTDGLTATLEPVEVADEELDAHLETIRQQARRIEPVAEHRPLLATDVGLVTVVFEAEGKEDHRREGMHVGLPDDPTGGFLDHLALGLSPGEKRGGTVTVPPNYGAEEWAGMTCAATAELTGIGRIVLPELDDEFAKRIGHESLAAARQDLHDQLLTIKEQRSRARAERQLVDQLVERNTFEVPPKLVVQRAQVLARAVGAELLGNASSGPTSLDDLNDDKKADVMQEAEFSVRRELLLDSLAERDGLTVSDEDRQSRIDDIAKRTGQPAETVRSYLVDSGGIESLDQRILEEKAIASLLDQATKG
ncbi:MAG: trigger factor [Deltaproteobacteria bacterium]|nr:trigger factor [Deltaproteobacteria bacterium]